MSTDNVSIQEVTEVLPNGNRVVKVMSIANGIPMTWHKILPPEDKS